ncbi:MAG TPA: hypothetical protein VGB06_00230 [Solirubrobacterales bacterium]|jgi:hypothetical protein
MTEQKAQTRERRELLLAAFADTEATIRATDTKASIALVVHGFVFSGVLGVLSRLGPWFGQASCSFRTLVIALSAVASLVFIASVTQLLRCVMPAPQRAIPQVPSKNVLYLRGKAGAIKATASGGFTFDQFKARLSAITPTEICDEFAGELMKISAIRARKVALARNGLGLLGMEIGLSTLLLGALAAHQL